MGFKLVIAEKPSVAQSIARVIGADDRRNGYLQENGYLVNRCFGHLIELAEQQEYDPRFKTWNMESLPILPEVLKSMSEDGNSYIIPMLASDKNFNRMKENLEYTDEFIYKAGKKETARILYYREEYSDGKAITIYKDMDENNSKRKSYMINIDLGEEGYTQEGYDQYSDWWGVYVLESITGNSAEEDFKDYKSRWSIVTFNNYIKNDADFNNLKIEDYCAEQGFNFIMLVCGLVHAKLNQAVADMNKTSISTTDVLLKAGHMRMNLNNGIWELQNTHTKDLELMGELGFHRRNPITRLIWILEVQAYV